MRTGKEVLMALRRNAFVFITAFLVLLFHFIPYLILVAYFLVRAFSQTKLYLPDGAFNWVGNQIIEYVFEKTALDVITRRLIQLMRFLCKRYIGKRPPQKGRRKRKLAKKLRK